VAAITWYKQITRRFKRNREEMKDSKLGVFSI